MDNGASSRAAALSLSLSRALCSLLCVFSVCCLSPHTLSVESVFLGVFLSLSVCLTD